MTKAKQTLFEALQNIQKEMPVIGKNKQGFKGSYADIEKVWEKIHPILAKNNFIVYHSVSGNGVETIAKHNSGEMIISTIPWGKDELSPQDRGKEITYYKRYNLLALFNIVIADEDSDGYTGNKKLDVKKADTTEAKALLKRAKTLKELQAIWQGITPEEKGDEAIIQLKDALKLQLK